VRLVTVKLKKKATADGMVEMHDHIKVGQEYTVDLDSIHWAEFTNMDKGGTLHVKEIIESFDHLGNYTGWLATELLDIPRD